MKIIKKKSKSPLIIKKRKLQAFTLIEVIIAIFILSIIAVSLTNTIESFIKLENNISLTGNNLIKNTFGLDYITKEIDGSKYLIIKNSPEFESGFILVQQKENQEKNFKYITFQSKDRVLNRLAYNTDRFISEYHIERFAKNKLLVNIKSIEGKVDTKTKIINLKIKSMDDETVEISHYFRGKIIE